MDWREAPEKFYYNMTKVNKKYTVNFFGVWKDKAGVKVFYTSYKVIIILTV